MTQITNGSGNLFLETGHALLGPSSAKRWLSCTPSARMSENIPDTPSPYAEEGTAAHTLAEIRLNFVLGRTPKDEYVARVKQAKQDFAEHVSEWTRAEWEAIDQYVEYCVEQVERLGGNFLTGGDALWEAEKVVSFDEYVPEGQGTSDFVIVAPKLGVIKAIDLKFGKGVAVDARDNPQAKLYALGAVLEHDPTLLGLFHTVQWAIVQPRISYTGEDETSLGALIDWAEQYVKPRAELAWAGEGEFAPSDDACRFCRAAPVCVARFEKNSAMAKEEFGIVIGEDDKMTETKPATSLTPEQIGEVLPKLDAFIAWAKSVQDRALVMARDEGVQIPGYKLVRGRSNRAWDSSVEDFDQQILGRLVKAGFDEGALKTDPVPPMLKSVAQVEKVTGKGKFVELVGDFVVKPLGTPALVPESDPREPMVESAEVLAAFGEFPETD